MYRGYIAVKDKKAIEPFKDVDNLRTLDEVKDLEGYAGVLADDSILIDVDDAGEAEILMDIIEDKQLLCRVYETTRGMHFVFKNNGVMKNRTGAKLAIGIDADIKIGTRNSYQVLKNNGEEREIIYDIFEDESIQELPKWLVPVDSNIDFLDLNEGDGRNQTLFNYILTLQSNEFTPDEARETLQIINDYVLSEPLDQSELETIYRDDAFSEEVFYGGKNGTTFYFDKFAKFIKDKHHIIKMYNALYIYDDGVYLNNDASIEYAMIKHIPRLRAAQRKEVNAYLKIINQHNEKETDADYISFRNGVLNIKTGELHPHDPKFIITNKIPWDYNPNAYDEVTDKTLNKMAVNDKQIRSLMEEMIGYTFYRRNELGKAFILTGEKNNGKSTFLDMVNNVLGEDNISALDLKELGERFKTAELNGKLANIGDDIDSDYIRNTGVFKKLVTGERMNVERKNEDPFDFKNHSKLLFSANSIPRLGSGKDSGAIMRRLVIIPFNAKFDKSEPDYDPYIIDKLTTQQATEYLIHLGIEALKRILANTEFTHSSKVDEEIEDYEKSTNPLIGFIEIYEEDGIDFIGQYVDDVYKRYTEYCIRDGYNALAKNEFSKRMQRQLEISTKRRTVDGKKLSYFTKIL